MPSDPVFYVGSGPCTMKHTHLRQQALRLACSLFSLSMAAACTLSPMPALAAPAADPGTSPPSQNAPDPASAYAAEITEPPAADSTDPSGAYEAPAPEASAPAESTAASNQENPNPTQDPDNIGTTPDTSSPEDPSPTDPTGASDAGPSSQAPAEENKPSADPSTPDSKSDEKEGTGTASGTATPETPSADAKEQDPSSGNTSGKNPLEASGKDANANTDADTDSDKDVDASASNNSQNDKDKNKDKSGKDSTSDKADADKTDSPKDKDTDNPSDDKDSQSEDSKDTNDKDDKDPEDDRDADGSLNKEPMQLQAANGPLQVQADVMEGSIDPEARLIVKALPANDASVKALQASLQNPKQKLLAFDIHFEKEGKTLQPAHPVHLTTTLAISGFENSTDLQGTLRFCHQAEDGSLEVLASNVLAKGTSHLSQSATATHFSPFAFVLDPSTDSAAISPLYSYARIAKLASGSKVSTDTLYPISVGQTNAPDPKDLPAGTAYTSDSAAWSQYAHDPFQGYTGTLQTEGTDTSLSIAWPANSAKPIVYNGVTYTYDPDNTKAKGTYTILDWQSMETADGANDFGTSSAPAGTPVWKQTGQVLLYDVKPATYEFYIRVFPATSFVKVASTKVTPEQAYLDSPEIQALLSFLPVTLKPGQDIQNIAGTVNNTSKSFAFRSWYATSNMITHLNPQHHGTAGSIHKCYAEYAPAFEGTYPLYCYLKTTGTASGGPISGARFYPFAVGSTNAPDPNHNRKATYDNGTSAWDSITHDPYSGWTGYIHSLILHTPFAVDYPAGVTNPIVYHGVTYTYDANNTMAKGTYAMKWNNMISDQGADNFNIPNVGSFTVNYHYYTWHMNGEVFIYDAEPCNMEFYIQTSPDGEWVNVFNKKTTPFKAYLNNIEVQELWSQLPLTLQPGESTFGAVNNSDAVLSLTTFKSGSNTYPLWFSDEACTQKANMNQKVPEGQTRKYYARYLPTPLPGSTWYFENEISNASAMQANTRFDYTLHVTKPDGSPYTGTLFQSVPSSNNNYNVPMYQLDASGDYHFQLGNGQYLQVMLPSGYTVTISQEEKMRWSTQSATKVGSAGSYSRPSNKTSWTFPISNYGRIKFINTPLSPIPTGVEDGHTQDYALLIAGCLLMVVFLSASGWNSRKRE